MSTTPAFDGFHHVSLTVADLDRSLAWYAEVLGFEEMRRVTVDVLEKALMTRDGLIVTFVAHGELAKPGPFDERQCGLDHLSFALPDRAALDAWVAHLDAHGVERGEITQAMLGTMVAFRDPDNIALEFYTRS